MRSFRRLILPCVAALAAGSALACSADSITAPTSAPVPNTHHVTGDRPGGAMVACTKREHQIGTATIGPRGGTLVVGANLLIVPAGALTKETVITGEVLEGTTAVMKFQPHGLQFRKPAALFLNASGCALPDYLPDVVYFDSESGEILERIQAVYSRWFKRVIAPISHFSSYAIAV